MSNVEAGLAVEREPMTAEKLETLGIDHAEEFPGSSPSDFRRYPVLSEGGWYVVVKHMPTLTSVHRSPWRPLGPVHLTSEGLQVD